MPIGGRPYLDYVLSSLADAGLRRVGLVIGPEHRDACLPYSEPDRATRVKVELIEQSQPLGTADAVRSAEQWVGGSAFVVINGDNLYPVQALHDVAALGGPGLVAFDRDELVRTGNIPADRLRSFALVTVDDAGRLSRIIEKPPQSELAASGPRALVSMNCWRFDARIFPACADVGQSPRGEYELTGAVALAQSRGVDFTVIAGHGTLLDLSTRSDVEAVSRHLIGIDPRP